MFDILALVFCLLAYFLGSISSAILVCRFFALPDPRTRGSGNPGATNVLRLGGKKAAVLTLFGDMLKGLLPVLLAKYFNQPTIVIAAVGVLAFLGHLYPLFFNFQGGKGVATLLGVLLGLSWQSGVLTIASWLVMAFVFNISSLSALVATALSPLFIWYFSGKLTLVLAVASMTIFLYWRHRTNIKAILNGSEGKIKE